jgi:hypothetical protein
MKLRTENHEARISKIKPGTKNPEPRTRNQEPGTKNPEPRTNIPPAQTSARL